MVTRIKLITLTALLFCSAIAASDETSEANSPTESNTKQVVFEVFDIMKEHVFTSDKVNWPSLKTDIDTIYASSSNSRFYDALYKILKVTDTGHSFYRSSSKPNFIMHKKWHCQKDDFSYANPTDDIGYVKVDGFGSSDRNKQIEFIKSIRQQIKQQHNDQLKGWILDISTNTGGNMWPMLAGLSPLLPNGIHGYFGKPDGSKSPWSTKDGNTYIGNNIIIGLKQELQIDNTLPIAVITGGKTISSGEAMFITFKGKSNARSFGQPSCGLSTTNRVFNLSNGAMLAVTTGTMWDSKSVEYGEQVPVDVQTTTPYVDADKWIRTFAE